MAIKAIIVDLFGTLLREDESVIKDICRTVCETSPLNIQQADVVRYWWERSQEAYAKCFGANFIGMRELEYGCLQATAEHFQARCDVDELFLADMRTWQNPDVYPDARYFLSRLPLKVCCIANADRADMEAVVRLAQLPVEHLICSEDVRAYKPRTEIFQKAIEELGVRPQEILHVGDSNLFDVEPAKKAGILAAWVNRSRRPIPADCQADAVFSSLQQLRSEMQRG